MMRHSICFAVLTGLLFAMSFAGNLNAQVVGATLSGVITDQSGAALPRAEVRIENSEIGIIRTVSTNAEGVYAAPNLQLGDYVLTASATGFTTVKTNITMTVGAKQVLNLVLKLGSRAETVEVTGEAPTINLADAAIGHLNDETTIRELPLNGRSWTDLATLQSGVASTTSVEADITSGDRFERGYGSQLSISGARPVQNNYRLNGISINDPTNGAPGSILGGNLGVDAISEFSILTTNYSTEYGRASGGIINAVTKAGTNHFHGDVYEFLRNSALDARNFFDPVNASHRIPPFKQNQFGVSAGGPIRKDKTFFFGGYEGVRQSLSISQVDTVPSAAARAGQLSTGNVIVDPQATRFLNAFYPLPNGQTFGDTGFFNVSRARTANENYFTGRIDHKLSDKDNLNGVFFYDNSDINTEDQFRTRTIKTLVNRKYIALEENHIFSSSTVNDFRAGFNRAVIGGPASATAINPAAADTSFDAVPGFSAPQINIGGLTSFPGGLSTASVRTFHWNTFQYYDDLLFSRGIHLIKIGANFERDQLNGLEHDNTGGIFDFNSLSNFLTNKPHDVRADAPGSVTPRYTRQSFIGTYIQDDVRLRPNLTVNMGLRWEMSTVPSEINNKVVNLRNLTDSAPHFGNPLFNNNTTRNFEPRLGFAWDPFRTGKTSVRGGFGLYDQFVMEGWLAGSISEAFPFLNAISAANLPPGSFPTGWFGPASSASGLHQSAHVDFNPGRSYVIQWNASIQRDVLPNLTAMIGYVGSHAVHGLIERDDANLVLPILTSPTELWPCEPFVPVGSPLGPPFGCRGIGSGTILNPNIGRLQSMFLNNSAVYHGLQLQLTKNMSHGFQVQGSFTWSKTIDDGSGTVAGDTFIQGITSGLYFNNKHTRAPSDFNTPRVFTLNYLWDIPVSQSFPRLARGFLGGWELGGIFTAKSGLPFTPWLAGDGLGLNSTDADTFPDRLGGSGCNSLVNPGNVNQYIKLQCFAVPSAVVVGGVHYLRPGTAGRNILSGPGLEDFDFSAMKNIRASERFTVQFRAEFFNLFNRANFKPPIDNQFILDPSIAGFGIVPADPTVSIVPGAGAIDATSTTSRQIQFGLKLIW